MKGMLNKAPGEWPFKYWLVIAGLMGSPQAANLFFNVTQNQPVRQVELQQVKNDLGELAYSNRNMLKHVEAIDDDLSLISEQVIRHDERLKAMAEIKARLKRIEDRYLVP